MLGMFWGERSGLGSDRVRPARRRVAAARRGHRPALEGLEERIALATDTWTGAAGPNWTTAGNWSTGVAPSPGDSLVFPAAAGNLVNNNDFPSNTAFGSITIQGAGTTSRGTRWISRAGSRRATDRGRSTYEIDTVLNAIVAPITVSSGAILDVGGTSGGGVLSGSAGLNVNGGGIVDLMEVNTYTGATTIASATTLIVDGTIGGVQDSGGGLAGNGSVGAVSSVGGTILPGHTASSTTTGMATPGQLTANGSFSLDSGSTFAALLDGTSPGNGLTGYSQLIVSSGTVNLGGSKFATALGTSYTPAVGDQLRIIVNNTGIRSTACSPACPRARPSRPGTRCSGSATWAQTGPATTWF